MSALQYTVVTKLIRAILQAAAGGLLAKGFSLSGDEWEIVTAAVLSVATFAWSLLESWIHRKLHPPTP